MLDRLAEIKGKAQAGENVAIDMEVRCSLLLFCTHERGLMWGDLVACFMLTLIVLFLDLCLRVASDRKLSPPPNALQVLVSLDSHLVACTYALLS